MTGRAIFGSYLLNVAVYLGVIAALICTLFAIAHGQNPNQAALTAQHDTIVNTWLNDVRSKPFPTNLETPYSGVHRATVDDWANDRIYYGRTYGSGYSVHNYNPALRWSLNYQSRVWQTQYNANPWNWTWNNNYYPRYRVIP